MKLKKHFDKYIPRTVSDVILGKNMSPKAIAHVNPDIHHINTSSRLTTAYLKESVPVSTPYLCLLWPRTTSWVFSHGRWNISYKAMRSKVMKMECSFSFQMYKYSACNVV